MMITKMLLNLQWRTNNQKPCKFTDKLIILLMQWEKSFGILNLLIKLQNIGQEIYLNNSLVTRENMCDKVSVISEFDGRLVYVQIMEDDNIIKVNM